MPKSSKLSRRNFLLASTCSLGAAVLWPLTGHKSSRAGANQVLHSTSTSHLKAWPFTYDNILMLDATAKGQMLSTMAVLLDLPTQSMVKPFLTKAGKSSAAADLGGWYDYSASYDWHTGTKDAERGFAPGHCFGQWMSGLARAYATTGDARYKAKVEAMVEAYKAAISPEFYRDLRFPAYTYDKLVLGLLDAHKLAACPGALTALAQTTAAAGPFLPAKALEREVPVAGRDVSYTWDESYTLPENLYLAYLETADESYKTLARRFLLDDPLFDALAAGKNKNIMAGKHAYSYVNALCSAAQAYIVDGDTKYLDAALHGYDILLAQSYATGGWGPDEQLRALDGDDLFKSLSNTHQQFETPCGAYAHLKLTRYLTMVTGKSTYADSAERILHNTIFGAKPLLKDGSAFYYSDYNQDGHKVYSSHVWPCCAGSLAQVSADYGINTYLYDSKKKGRHDIYVMQYLDSQLKWQIDNLPLTLSQSTKDETTTFSLQHNHPSARPVNLHLRIPSYPAQISLSLGDDFTADMARLTPGAFFEISSKGKPDSSFSITVKPTLRIEPLNEKHPEMVALMYGPSVLFAVNAREVATGGGITKTDLLGARRVDENTWYCPLANGQNITFKPFTAIVDEPYTTYLKLSS